MKLKEMELNNQKLEIISTNDLFLREPIFNCCFSCGENKYCEFYFMDHLYRLCDECLEKPIIRKFFNDQVN